MPTTTHTIDAALLADGTMTIAQVAEFTGYSRDSIELMLDHGELPWTQLRGKGRRLIPRLAVIQLLQQNMVNGGAVAS